MNKENRKSIEDEVKKIINLTEEQFDEAIDLIEDDLLGELLNLKKLRERKERDKGKYSIKYVKQDGIYTYQKYRKTIGFKKGNAC